MKLSVLKNNIPIKDFNLSKMIKDGEKGPFSFFLGRSPECQIHLDSREISRIQAQITYDNEIWSIKNRSPQIPIFLNGAVVEKSNLEEGSSILIGPFRLIASAIEKVEVPEKAPEGQAGTEPGVETKTEEMGTTQEIPTATETPEISQGDFSLSGGSVTETVPPESPPEQPAPTEGVAELTGEAAAPEAAESGEKTADIPIIKFELELQGKYAPFGSYIIDRPETFIGRDEKKCQIILKDPEVSAVHAVVRRKHYTCEIEDLNSKNGIVHNGVRVNKLEFASDVQFSIGTTNFLVKAHTEFLNQEAPRLMPVEENQEIEVEKIVEEGAVLEGQAPAAPVPEGKKKFNLKDFIQEIKSDPVKKKRAMMIGGVLVLALLMIDTTPEKPKPKEPTKKAEVSDKAKKGIDDKLKKFTPEQLDFLDSAYLLAKELFKQGKYAETLFELQKIFSLTPDYKNAKQIHSLAKTGLAKMEELERKRLEEIERKKREQRIKEMTEKATEAVKNRESELAKGLFGQILKLDPENYEVTQLKLEIESWEAEEKRKKEEEETKRIEREKRVEQLAPGKKFFLAQDWYKAIIRLNEFLEITPMDEDLIKEATDMLKDSKQSLSNIVDPILEKAETLREGGDLKGAYEEYKKALLFDPGLEKPLEEMKKISEKLQVRAGRVYREAIISESLSLFQDAKEKFLEVQQISPSDGEYYEKATQRLKNYLDYQ